jgi:hypothetical protein
MISQELSSVTLYHRDVAPYQQGAEDADNEGTWEKELVHQALAGNAEARQTIVMEMQNYIQYWARRLTRTYGWASSRIEYLELISEGNLAVMERLDCALRDKETYARPYLAAIAKYAMKRFCKRYASLISQPEDTDEPHTRVSSLNMPLRNEADRTVEDLLAGPAVVLTTQEDRSTLPSITLASALSLLTQQYQSVLTRWYGLGDSPQESAKEIAVNLADRPIARQAVEAAHRESCERLRVILQAPRDAQGRPALYTVRQVQKVLDMPAEACRAILPRRAIRPFAHMLYHKEEIDALVQERRQMLDEREQRAKRTPEQQRQEQLQKAREYAARYRAKKRAQQQEVGA